MSLDISKLNSYNSSKVDLKNSKQQTATMPEINSSTVVSDNLPDYRFNASLASNAFVHTTPTIKSLSFIKRSLAPLLTKCHYGKQNLFANLDSLKAYKENDKIFLDGFYSPNDSDGEITGICEELTQKIGSKIAQMYSKDYSVLALFTKGTKYNFSNHMCIGMIPKNKINDEIMKAISDIDDIYKAIKQKSQLGEDTKDLDELYQIKLQENQERIEKSDFWENAIFVDPSYGVVCKLDDLPDNYELTGYNSLEGNNPFNRVKELDPGLGTPLGTIQDIFPEFIQSNDIGSSSMVSFGLYGDSPDKVFTLIEDSNDGSRIVLSLEDIKEEYSDSNMCKFVERIENQLS